MSEMTMREMIERYVYDVVRRLPQSQREDISRELRTLIDDMMEERADSGKTEQENAEEVLKELGSPFALAGKYRDSKKYLIGQGVRESGVPREEIFVSNFRKSNVIICLC